MRKILLGLIVAVSLYGVEVNCSVGKNKYNLEINKNELVDIPNGDVFIMKSSKVNQHKVKVYNYENMNKTLIIVIGTDILERDGIAEIYLIGEDMLKGICVTTKLLDSNK